MPFRRLRLLQVMGDMGWILRLKVEHHVQELEGSRFLLWVTDMDTRRRLKIGAALMVVGGIGVLVVAVAAVATYPYLWGESRWADLKTMDACTESLTVYDSAGWLGRVPESMLAKKLFASNSKRCAEIGYDGWRSHNTDYASDPPDEWWLMVLAIEDRRHGTWASVNCVDILAVAKVLLKLLRGQMDRGGSTVTMQLARSLRGIAPSFDEHWQEKARRKLDEILDATVLCRKLGGSNSLELRRWVARHLPYIHGTKSSELGGSIYGIEASSRVLFDKAPEELDLEEMAILAAASRRQVLFAPPNRPEEQQRAQKRWELIQKRARRVLDLAFGTEEPDVVEAKARLDRMSLPDPMRMIAPDLADVLPKDPAKRIATLANPERRVKQFAGDDITQALGELYDLNPTERHGLIGFELTVNAADNAEFKRKVKMELKKIEDSTQLRLTLLPNTDGSDLADFTASLVNGDGHVVRHYSAREDGVWSGANTKRDEAGRYRPDREDRDIGSLTKMLAALLIAARFDVTDTACNRWLDGLRNPNGHKGFVNCGSKRARVGVAEAFAKSLNLAIAWALEKVPREEIKALTMAAGLRLTDDGTEPRVKLAFGMVAGGPRAQIRMAAALNRGARNLPAQAVLPTLIKMLYFRNEDGSVRTVPFDKLRDHRQIDLDQWFQKPDVAPFVGDVLSAPGKPGGTLRGFNRVIIQAGGSDWIVKTGTTTNNKREIRDQIVVGSFVDGDGDQKTFHLQIGASDPNKPLANSGGVPRKHRLRLIEQLLVRDNKAHQGTRRIQ